jgi:hypothetical protein
MKTIYAAGLFCIACYAQSVTIVNSGSTNTAGFQIVVQSSGQAEYTLRPRRHVPDKTGQPKTVNKSIPKSLAKSVYADVKAAQPLSSLPARGCAKSASFGTRLTIQFGDDTSPDLSCGDGGNSNMKALVQDANAIVKIFRSE